MTQQRDIEEHLSLWMEEEGATHFPDRVLEATFGQTRNLRQVGSSRWRTFPMLRSFGMLAAAGAAAVMVVVVGALFLRPLPGQPGVGASPSANPRTPFVQVVSYTSPDGEVSVSAPSSWSAWLPGSTGGHELGSGVWFGQLWRVSDHFFHDSGEHIAFVDPVAYDAWCAANDGSPLLSAPANAAEIAQQVIADPNFESTEPVAARIGGLDALSMDVALAPGGEACGIGMIEIGRWIHSMGWQPGLRQRLYLVDLPDGMSVETLAISVQATADRLDEFIAETAPIIESIEFHPGR